MPARVSVGVQQNTEVSQCHRGITVSQRFQRVTQVSQRHMRVSAACVLNVRHQTEQNKDRHTLKSYFYTPAHVPYKNQIALLRSTFAMRSRSTLLRLKKIITYTLSLSHTMKVFDLSLLKSKMITLGKQRAELC